MRFDDEIESTVVDPSTILRLRLRMVPLPIRWADGGGDVVHQTATGALMCGHGA